MGPWAYSVHVRDGAGQPGEHVATVSTLVGLCQVLGRCINAPGTPESFVVLVDPVVVDVVVRDALT